jgi:hypothetical protein
VNLAGRWPNRWCAVLGMRCLGPVFGVPVVVIRAGTMGLLLLLLL